jgi:2-oxoglutarate dehydrogenase E2 component (dihydrolipoamide succinyltransferase)
MPIVEMIMPKMGESIMEATVLTWLKKVGDSIEQDESVLEVATDKIDTEVPASESGVLVKILVKEGQIAEIGKAICLIEVADLKTPTNTNGQRNGTSQKNSNPSPVIQVERFTEALVSKTPTFQPILRNGDKFYSPLVLSIATAEGLAQKDLDNIEGTGLFGRVTKIDIEQHLLKAKTVNKKKPIKTNVTIEPGDEIVPMDRMRTMIAERMLDSQAISAHVTSFVECDMSHIVAWRPEAKNWFKTKYNENFTYTPILIQAVAQALVAYPGMNVQVDGMNIVKKAQINIGMAVALANGNLVVPKIPNAHKMNLLQITQYVNNLTSRGRDNKLKPDDLEGGTFTVSNIGTFGNLMGTPIIMQPQVGIIAFGAIVKTPSVISGPNGDEIGIRSKMYISHSYDHRIIDGSLGGQFVKKVADLLEKFDGSKELSQI